MEPADLPTPHYFLVLDYASGPTQRVLPLRSHACSEWNKPAKVLQRLLQRCGPWQYDHFGPFVRNVTDSLNFRRVLVFASALRNPNFTCPLTPLSFISHQPFVIFVVENLADYRKRVFLCAVFT